MMGSVFLWYKLVPNGQGMIIARFLWHGIYDAVSMIDHDLSLPFDRYVLFFQMQIVGNLWIDKWAASRQIQQYDRCAQQSLRSAGALAMSDQFSLSTWRKLGSSAQQRLLPNGQRMIIARYLWHGIYDAESMNDHDLSLPFDGIYDAVSMIDHDLSLPFDRYVLLSKCK